MNTKYVSIMSAYLHESETDEIVKSVYEAH